MTVGSRDKVGLEQLKYLWNACICVYNLMHQFFYQAVQY